MSMRACSREVRRFHPINPTFGLALLAGLMMPIAALAATFTWNGGANDGIWDTSVSQANWVGGVYTAGNSTANNYVFTAASPAGTSTIMLQGGHNPDAANFAINASAWNPTTINIASANANTHLDFAPTASGAETVTISAGAHTIKSSGTGTGGFVQLKSYDSQVFNIASGASLTVATEIQGAATRGFTKAGAGTLALTAVNSYGGNTTLSAGTISIDSDATFGSGTGTLNLAGGSLTLTGSRATADNILTPFNMTADTTIQNGSASANAVYFRHGGIWTTTGGTLTIKNATGSGGFDLVLSNSFTFSRPIVIGAAGDTYSCQLSTYVQAGGTQIFTEPISGYGSYRHTAGSGLTAGTAILSGANTYSGGCNLNDGGTGFGISSTGNPVTSGPAGIGTLTFGGIDASVWAEGAARTIGNAVSVPTGLTVGGQYDLEFTGAVNLEGGVRPITITNTAATTLSGNVSNGGMTKAGASALTLNGDNSYTLGTTINAGAIIAKHNNALGTGGTVSIASGNYSQQLILGANGLDVGRSLTIGGGGVAGQGILHYNQASGSATYSGNITINASASAGGHFGSASGGELILTGTITSSATVTVRAGTVRFSNSGSSYNSLIITGIGKLGVANAIPTGASVDLGLSTAGALDLNGLNQELAGLTKHTSFAAVVDNSAAATSPVLTLNIAGANDFAGVIRNSSGTVSLTKTGVGTLTLSGTNTYSGPTTVSAGKLLVSGSLGSGTVTVQNSGALAGAGSIGGNIIVENGGKLAPGTSIGTLMASGDLMLNSGSTTEAEVDRGASPNADQVQGIGTLTQGGALSVINNGGALQINDSFVLFSATAYSGQFAAINPANPNSNTNLAWDLPALKSTGVLKVHHVPDAHDITVSRNRGASVKIPLSNLFAGTDAADGDTVVLQGYTAGTQGATISNSGTAFIYESPSNNNDAFDYTVTDNRGGTRTKRVTVNVVQDSAGPVTIENNAGQSVTLSFWGIPQFQYTIQRSPAELQWEDVVTNTAATNGLIQYTETPPWNPTLYRVRAE